MKVMSNMRCYASMITYSFLVFFIVICLSLYVLGIAYYITGTNDEPNTCDLPYMFEFPEFVEIPMDDGINRQYPGFGLYGYGESDGAEKIRQMEFSGIPVLFVPGHAGSHRQIRSIASVSLMMSSEQRSSFHFDYFTASLAEGLSALSGGVIEKQTDFVSFCIHRILSLYHGKVDQLVVIGHSMGGVVARAALLRNTINATLASILINLASPYHPIVAFDRTFSNYYDEINNHEVRLHEMGTSIIAIGGGPRDHQVATSYMIDPHADLNVISTAIPNVWRSTDHISILWCKQFVVTLVRALFSCVDEKEQVAKITSNAEQRLEKLRYVLSNRYMTDYPPHFENKINFESDGEWIEITSPTFIFDAKNHKYRQSLSTPIYLMIPVKRETFNYLSLDTINLKADDWLFICSPLVMKNNSRTCTSGWNLTNYTVLSLDYQQRLRKIVDLEPHILEKFHHETHIVIRIPSSEIQEKVPPIVYVDMYSRKARETHIYNEPSKWLPPSLSNIIAVPADVTIEIQPGTLRQFITISAIPDAIYIELDSIAHDAERNSSGYAIIHLKEMPNNPSSAMSQFHIFRSEDIGCGYTLYLQAGIDTSISSNTAEIIMSFDPRFRYIIRVGRAGLPDRMANFFKNRAHRLHPAIMCTLLLFTVSRIDKSQYSLPITFGVTFIASIVLDLLLEFFVAVSVLSILIVIICWGVIFIGTIIHHVIVRIFARPLARLLTSWYSGLIWQTLNNLPLVAIILLIMFALCRCGALVMLVSASLYFLQLTCLYKNCLENTLMLSVRDLLRIFRKSSKVQSSSREEEESVDVSVDVMNHLSLVLIWFLTAGCGVPSILVWLRGSSYNDRLFSEDPIMLGCWIVLTLWCSLGFTKPPISFQYHCHRVDPLILTQRLLGWSLLWIAALNNAVSYQWMIPPIVALFISCHFIRQNCMYIVRLNPHFPELKSL